MVLRQLKRKPHKSSSSTWTTNFSMAFNVSAHDSKLWIERGGSAVELQLRGASWFGFEGLHMCPGETRRHSPDKYISFLKNHGFNAVRLPLMATTINDNPRLDGTRQIFATNCAREMLGHRLLDNVYNLVAKLKRAGIFVMLDMHLQSGSAKHLWCRPADATVGCVEGDASSSVNDAATDWSVRQAWATLAARFCDEPNVILADLYNEPAKLGGATVHWAKEGAPPGLDWRAFATRLGNEVLAACPRWLIAVQGIGSGSQCVEAAGSGNFCWWGENLLGMLDAPIELSIPHRLVLTPHTYGHGNQAYNDAPTFPANMPRVWDALWGGLPARTGGVPIVLGEWGGLWDGDEKIHKRATGAWQTALAAFLAERGFSSFYWCLNDDAYTTGGLFDAKNHENDAVDAAAEEGDDAVDAAAEEPGRHRRRRRGEKQRRTLLFACGDAEAEVDSDTEQGVELSRGAALRIAADAATDDVPLWVREAGGAMVDDDDDNDVSPAHNSKAKHGRRKSRRSSAQATLSEAAQLD